MGKLFEEMNPLEKHIYNNEYMIESLKKAIQILQDNKADFIPQSILQSEIYKRRDFIDEMKKDLANGKTEL